MNRINIFVLIALTSSLLLLPAFTSGLTSSNVTLTANGVIQNIFHIHGADTGLNIICPDAKNYHADAAVIFKDALGMNTIRFQCGGEGDVWGINMVNNAANDTWADNLERLLSTVDSMGLKCYFYSLGDPWGGELGINEPSYAYTQNGYPINPTPIPQVKMYIDQLAGNNKLHHNFITDPRIVFWSVANEAYIGTVSSSGVVTTNSNYDWIIQVCDYIRSKGGKTVVPSPLMDTTAVDGNSWNTAFRLTEPLLRGHVDYLENHYYGVYELIHSYSLGNEQYNWTAWKIDMQQKLQEMVDNKGAFSIDQVILGEFGIYRETGTEWGTPTWYFNDENRRDYYENMFQIIKNVGLLNVCFHWSIDELSWDMSRLAYSTNYGVIDPYGQPYPYAADIIKQEFASLLAL